jgi:hypothetical protein
MFIGKMSANAYKGFGGGLTSFGKRKKRPKLRDQVGSSQTIELLWSGWRGGIRPALTERSASMSEGVEILAQADAPA